MPHRITPLSKKILEVIKAERVPNEIAFAARLARRTSSGSRT
jgi:hypothetical protein